MSPTLRAIAIAVAVALLAGVGWSQAAHRGRKPRCSLRGSYTVYQDTALRVYTKDYFPDPQSTDYACLFSTGRRRKIATFYDYSGGEQLDLIHAQAPWVAYSLLGGYKGGGSWGRVCVLNLRTNARRCEFTDDYDTPFVFGLSLTRKGSFAWIDSRFEPPGYTLTVHKLDAGASDPVVLDTGKDIERKSLAVGGHYIYWTKAEKRQSATMP